MLPEVRLPLGDNVDSPVFGRSVGLMVVCKPACLGGEISKIPNPVGSSALVCSPNLRLDLLRGARL